MISATSTERMAVMAQRYEARLLHNRRWAKRYYDANSNMLKTKKLLAGVAKGRCPSKGTLDRLGVDPSAVAKAWTQYATSQDALSKKALDFHRYITGSEWSDPKKDI